MCVFSYIVMTWRGIKWMIRVCIFRENGWWFGDEFPPMGYPWACWSSATGETVCVIWTATYTGIEWEGLAHVFYVIVAMALMTAVSSRLVLLYHCSILYDSGWRFNNWLEMKVEIFHVSTWMTDIYVICINKEVPHYSWIQNITHPTPSNIKN